MNVFSLALCLTCGQLHVWSLHPEPGSQDSIHITSCYLICKTLGIIWKVNGLDQIFWMFHCWVKAAMEPDLGFTHSGRFEQAKTLHALLVMDSVIYDVIGLRTEFSSKKSWRYMLPDYFRLKKKMKKPQISSLPNSSSIFYHCEVYSNLRQRGI